MGKTLTKEDLSVGEKIKFKHKGSIVVATIKRLNDKTIGVEGDGFKGRVSYWMVKKASNDEKVTKLPPKKKSEGKWTPEQKRDYDISNKSTIDKLNLQTEKVIRKMVLDLARVLKEENQDTIHLYTNEISEALCYHYKLPSLKIWTKGKRQVHNGKEKYGEHRTRDLGTEKMRSSVSVFSRTAKTQRIVAPKTFLKTLVHEWVHHYDRYHLKIVHEYHTSGFYGRVKIIYEQLKTDLE